MKIPLAAIVLGLAALAPRAGAGRAQGVKGKRVRFVGAVDRRSSRSGRALRSELRRLWL